MNLRDAYNRFRLARGGLSIALLVNWIWLPCWFGAYLSDHPGFRRPHALQIVLIFASLVAILVLTAFFTRQSIRYQIKRIRAARAWTFGDLTSAEHWFRQALTCADEFAHDDPCRGDTLHELARILRRQKKLAEAEIVARQAFHTKERAWGPVHAETAHELEYLADVYSTMGCHAQAALVFEEAMRRHEAAPTRRAVQLNILAEFWLRCERPDKAEPLLRRALDLADKHLDPLWTKRLPFLVNLCDACARLGQLDEADQLIQEAIALARKIAPAQSWSVASCQHQLASVRRKQGRFPEAEEIVRRAIAILRSCDGEDAVCDEELHLLGDVLCAQARWVEAEECYQQVLHFRDECLSPVDLAIARILEDYAELLASTNRTVEGQAFVKRAREIREFHSPIHVA